MKWKLLFLIAISMLYIPDTVNAAEGRIVSGVTFSDTIQVYDALLGEVSLRRVVIGSENYQLYELTAGYPVSYNIAEEAIYYSCYGNRSDREGALVPSGLQLADGIPPDGVGPGSSIQGEYETWLESRRLDTRDWHQDVSGDYRIAIVPIACNNHTGWDGFNVADAVPFFHDAVFGHDLEEYPQYIEGPTNELTVKEHFDFAGRNGNGGINIMPDDLRGEYDPEHPGWITPYWNGGIPTPFIIDLSLEQLEGVTSEGFLAAVLPAIEALGYTTETDAYNVFLLLWGMNYHHVGSWAIPVGVEASHMCANIWTDHQLLSSGELCRMIFGTFGYGELDPTQNSIGRAHLLCEGWQGPPNEGNYPTYWKPAWVDPYIEQCLGWWEPMQVDAGEDFIYSFNDETRLIFPDPRDSERMRTLSGFDPSLNFYKGHREDACSYLCDITLSSWNHQLTVESIPAVHPTEGENYAFPWHGVDSLDFDPWEQGRDHPHELQDIAVTPTGGEISVIWQGMPPLGLQLQECSVDLNGNGKVRLWNYGYSWGEFTVVVETGTIQEAGSASLAGDEVGDCLIPGLPPAPVQELGSTLDCLVTVYNADQDTVLHQQVPFGRTLPAEPFTQLISAHEQLFSSGDYSVLWQWDHYSVMQEERELFHDWSAAGREIQQAWIAQTAPLMVLQTTSWDGSTNYWCTVDLETGSVSWISYIGMAPLTFEMGEELIFFAETVNGSGESWIFRRNLLDDTVVTGEIIPFIPEQGCALPNDLLPLMGLTQDDNLIICTQSGAVLLDWEEPFGDNIGQPLAADFNWDGWYDVLLPMSDGWYIFYFDSNTLTFTEYYHSQPDVIQETITPVYNGQHVVVGAIGQDCIRIGATEVPLPGEGFTSLHSADVNEDGSYEYFVSGEGQGIALLKEDGTPHYGDFLPWLVQHTGQGTEVHFQQTAGENTYLVLVDGERFIRYEMPTTFPVLWNGRSSDGNAFAHPITGSCSQPPPHLNLSLYWTTADQPALSFEPAPGDHILNGFHIYRSTDPYQFDQEPLIELGPCSRSWIDTDPPPGENCYYRVTMLLDDPAGPICSAWN